MRKIYLHKRFDSLVVSTEVYRGTKKNDNNFVAKLLSVNNPMFLKRYLYLFIIIIGIF